MRTKEPKKLAERYQIEIAQDEISDLQETIKEAQEELERSDLLNCCKQDLELIEQELENRATLDGWQVWIAEEQELDALASGWSHEV